MKLIYTVCAENVIIDQFTNKVTLIAVADGYQFPQFPIVLANLALVVAYGRQADEPEHIDGTVKFRLNDQPIFEAPIKVDFQGNLRTRLVSQISGFVISGPGTMKATVAVPGAEDANWTIEIQSLAVPSVEQIGPQ